MKKYFLMGIAFLLPFVITLFILIWVIDFLTNPFLSLTKDLILFFLPMSYLFLEEHHFLGIILSRIFILLSLLFFTCFFGFLADKYIFSSCFSYLQKIFLKMPIIRAIYKICKDIASSTVSADAPLFQQTVLIPFPHQDSLALGLVVKEVPPCTQKETDIEIAVFVPTSPHPISGFLLLTPKKWTKPVDLSTEEVFKYLISCGANSPEKTKGPDV